MQIPVYFCCAFSDSGSDLELLKFGLWAQISDLKVTDTELKLFLEMFGLQSVDSRLAFFGVFLLSNSYWIIFLFLVGFWLV